MLEGPTGTHKEMPAEEKGTPIIMGEKSKEDMDFNSMELDDSTMVSHGLMKKIN